MIGRVGWLGVSAAISWGALVALSAPAFAQSDEDLPDSIEDFAFDAADTDGDGLISEAELTRDAAAGFSKLDTNRDGELTPEELGPHDPALFQKVDTDGDGKLTFSEVMNHKLQGFTDADTDADGYLSFDEMVAGAAAEQGVEP